MLCNILLHVGIEYLKHFQFQLADLTGFVNCFKESTVGVFRF